MIASADDQSKYPAPTGEANEAVATLVEVSEVLCNFAREYGEEHHIGLAAMTFAVQMSASIFAHNLSHSVRESKPKGA